MSDRRFGWSYPPGCSGPPEGPDPHPKSEEIYDLLENAGCSQDVIDKACEIVEELAALSERECPHCEQRKAEDFRKSGQEFTEITRLTAELETIRTNYDSAVHGRAEMRAGLKAWKQRAEAAEQQVAALDKVIGVETIGQRSVQLIFECGDDAEVALLPLRQIVEQKERTK